MLLLRVWLWHIPHHHPKKVDCKSVKFGIIWENIVRHLIRILIVKKFSCTLTDFSSPRQNHFQSPSNSNTSSTPFKTQSNTQSDFSYFCVLFRIFFLTFPCLCVVPWLPFCISVVSDNTAAPPHPPCSPSQPLVHKAGRLYPSNAWVWAATVMSSISFRMCYV